MIELRTCPKCGRARVLVGAVEDVHDLCSTCTTGIDLTRPARVLDESNHREAHSGAVVSRGFVEHEPTAPRVVDLDAIDAAVWDHDPRADEPLDTGDPDDGDVIEPEATDLEDLDADECAA